MSGNILLGKAGNRESQLNLQEILTEARGCMQSLGSCEIPPFQGFLAHSWMHPDFFSRCFYDGPYDMFSLQPVSRNYLHEAAEEGATVKIVRFFKPFSREILKSVPGYISRVLNISDRPVSQAENVSSSETASYFEVWGTMFKPSLLRETACYWNCSWKGYPIGSAMVLSGLFDEPLAEPVGFVLFDLKALQRVSQKNDQVNSLWNSRIDTSEILSLQPRKSIDSSDRLFSLSEKRLDEIHEEMEIAIAGQMWIEAYYSYLEAFSLASDSFTFGSQGEILRNNFENKFKTLMGRFASLVRSKLSASPEKNREPGVKS